MYQLLKYITALGSLGFLICVAYPPLRTNELVLGLGTINSLLVFVWLGLRTRNQAS
jgi:hypothetical protein